MSGRNLLPLLGIEVVQISRGNIARMMLVDDFVHQRYRRFGQNADGRRYDLDFSPPKLLDGKKRFVFPCNQNIANASTGYNKE